MIFRGIKVTIYIYAYTVTYIIICLSLLILLLYSRLKSELKFGSTTFGKFCTISNNISQSVTKILILPLYNRYNIVAPSGYYNYLLQDIFKLVVGKNEEETISDITNAFEIFDRDDDGRLQTKDLHRALTRYQPLRKTCSSTKSPLKSCIVHPPKHH